ncbi:hypothetical protein ABGB17_21820 [Sphaerisporangium sp. B11E5]|uniref:hypothetical protein n=1 Tax=Sphaerisporangium sp. B11E5 TaxID=3153563 RepID=UPI00325E06B1
MPRDEPARSVSRAAAEALLARRYAPAAVAATAWERLEPWEVARVRLAGPGVPERLIVKWVRAHPDRTRSARWRVRTEVAALRFLADDLGFGAAPRLITADIATGVVVLEDLGPRVPLDGVLREGGAAAHRERLLAFARVRGELGAASAGRAEDYYARRAALGAVDPAADRAGRWSGFRDEGIRVAARIGAEISGGAGRELEVALGELAEPRGFLALSNGDPEANNVLVHASGAPDARLIDFEFAGYTHALHDAVCLFVPGPGWLSVGDAIGIGAGDAYRRALAAGVPEAQDDARYGRGLAAACVSYALVRLCRVPTLDGRAPGDGSRPQLVATLEAAARTAGAFRALPRLAGWAWRAAEALRRRWPDADVDLSAVPAYAPRGR